MTSSLARSGVFFPSKGLVNDPILKRSVIAEVGCMVPLEPSIEGGGSP